MEKLIANVGLTAWSIFLLLHVSRFPVFAIAGGSTASFGLLYHHLSTKAASTWGVRANNEHFLNAITTTVHAILASTLAYSSVCSEYDTLYTDLRQNSSLLSNAAVGISTGYFAYDLWHLVHADMVRQSPALLVHHLAIIVLYSIVIIESQFYPYMVLTLLCEPHSMIMQLRKIAKTVFDVPRGLVENRLQNRVYWGLWVMNGTTCVVTRMVPHAAILYSVYRAWDDTNLFPHAWMFNCAMGGMSMINVINGGLVISLYFAYKKDSKLVRNFRSKLNDGNSKLR